jgi:hypothetical protein
MPMKILEKCKMIIVMILPPARTRARATAVEVKLWQACFKDNYILHCNSTSSFVQGSWDGDAES